jgi:hypothetical protein
LCSTRFIVASRPDSTPNTRILKQLQRHGVLLESDPLLPSVASLVAGEPIRGSWWGHPRGHAIFLTCESLCERDDVLVAKLISGKRTYVHHRVWPQLVAVAGSNRAWQTQDLSTEAHRLRQRVQRRGRVRTDEMRGYTTKALGAAARELESRLLVHAESVHTERGSHAKVLETWAHWTRRCAPGLERPSWDEARREIEVLVEDYAGAGNRRVWLPWKR